MALDFGLTEKGYIAPTYEEILDSYEDDLRTKLSNNITLAPNSTLGILARVFSWRTWQLIDQLQKVYYSPFISTSTNSSLDRFGSNIGVKRKVAEHSFANIVITTEEEYLIQAGEQFETDEGIVFDLIKDVTTVKQDNGSWQGIGMVQSVETGSMTNVAPNTITIVSNPDTEIVSVTNLEAASGGQDYEDDSTYRARLQLENTNSPGPTEAGVKSALLNLAGVREVNIVQNSSSETDKDGNPPYSVHIYCLGGRDDEIANTIINTVAAGITLTGSKSVKTVDATGNTATVKFDYAKNKPVFAKITLKTDFDWNNDEGADNVKEVVSEYINGLEMGETVVLTKVYPAIYLIKGIKEALIEIGTSADSVNSTDIKTSSNEAVSCQKENIQVVINNDL